MSFLLLATISEQIHRWNIDLENRFLNFHQNLCYRSWLIHQPKLSTYLFILKNLSFYQNPLLNLQTQVFLQMFIPTLKYWLLVEERSFDVLNFQIIQRKDFYSLDAQNIVSTSSDIKVKFCVSCPNLPWIPI